ncbi:protein kinase, partial [Micrococcus sp.]|uniref:protein kinase domain-containing protein n=1 Tax=Micrococcus sp. TaxID=1271 RepID=UPI0026DAA77F
MSSARRDPLVGTTVEDRYEVLERVARGGMSTVYRALDHRLDRMVALKVMHPHLAEDPALVARFEREAKTAARISHPHVVAVLDQGHTVDASGETVAYLVMEFVAGRTLRSVIRAEAPLTPRRALDLLQPTLAGLAAAHRAGLVHRDVKPENVLVREDGRVTVADFGLSRAATGHTSTGQAVLGTPAYLAPEHIAGEHADTRADVYAAGILLFELLTGRQPFTAAGPLQVAYRHLHERVPVPSTLVPGLAESLDDLVLWCTEPDPRDRPQDAVVLLGELERVGAGLSDAELDHVPPAAAGGSAGHGRPAEDEADDDGADPDGADIDIEEHPDSETLPVPRRAADGPRDGALPPDDDATRTLPVAVVSDGRGSGMPARRR